jgi:hypothetical protein
MNQRLVELGLKYGSHMLEKLETWTADDIRKAIVKYETGSAVDKGAAQFLRLYLAARTLGTVSKRIS